MVFCAAVAALFVNHSSAQDPSKVKAGEQVYQAYCSTCHGDDLQNPAPTTFDLRKLKADDRPRFVNSVLNGKGQMPPWKGALSEEQIDQVWNFVRSRAYEK